MSGVGPVEVVYTDVDGTLTHDGSLLHHPLEGPCLHAVTGLHGLHRKGVKIVPVSGRTSRELGTLARLVGARTWIAEMGSVIHHPGGRTRVYDAREDAPAEAFRAAGVVEALVEAFPERVEPHTPWFHERTYTLPLRGRVDVAEATRVAREVMPGVRVVDNGVTPHHGDLDLEEVHVHHVLYEDVTKARAVARDLERRGVPPERAVAIGDSPADATMAGSVGTFFLVDPRCRVPETGNVVVTSGTSNRGFLEAVRAIEKGP